MVSAFTSINFLLRELLGALDSLQVVKNVCMIPETRHPWTFMVINSGIKCLRGLQVARCLMLQECSVHLQNNLGSESVALGEYCGV